MPNISNYVPNFLNYVPNCFYHVQVRFYTAASALFFISYGCANVRDTCCSHDCQGC